MKKVFNLSVILAVLASALTFTSCDDDDDEATITITGTENAGEYVISAEAEIDEIAIYKESGDNESKMTSESEALTKAAKGQTTFLVNFSLFGEGTYKMSVKDKEGREEIKKNITVGSAAELNWVDEIEVSTGDVVFYKNADGQGEIKVVMANEASITVQIDGGEAVTISDAGESYILPDGSTSGINALKDKWETAQILVAKVMDKSMLAGGNGASLNTKFATKAAQLAK